jgi:hypothetical protein
MNFKDKYVIIFEIKGEIYMKYNYPVKYAIMPIYKQTDWIQGLNELERDFEVIGYIVSKCYVLSEKTKYLEDGSKVKEYEVVFPYQKNDYMSDEFKRVYPKYNINNQCYNSKIVSNLYDNYIDALSNSKTLNDKILANNLGKLYFNSDYHKNSEKIQTDHKNLLKNLKILESKIEEETSDMITMNEPLKQSIIVIFDDKVKILPLSIYNFIELYKNTPFYVCNVNKKDYEKMCEQVKNNSFETNKYLSLYLLANDVENKIIRIASDCHQGSEYIDENNKLCYSSEIYQFYKDPIFKSSMPSIKVYTTETYEDIINSYKLNSINNDKIKILKKATN